MPSLHFSRYRDIAAGVAARLSQGREGAIVASRGLANAITADALRASERGAVSLPLSTIDAFAQRVVNEAGEYPRVATDAERRLAMRGAARAISDLGIDPQRLGVMLDRSYRDVRDGGITIADFEARVRRASSLRNRRRTEGMTRAWKQYEQLVAQIGAVDPADVLARAAELIASGDIAVADQIVAGFYDMTGAQLRIVHALGEKVTAIYVPSVEKEPFASRFVTSLGGLKPVAADPMLHIKQPASTVTQYENRFVELREVCREIAARIGPSASLRAGSAPLSIAIVARSLSPYDIRLINRFATELGFTTSGIDTMPLVAQRIGRGIVMLLRLRERSFPRLEVFDVLRDGFRTEQRISIDSLDYETRKKSIARGDSEAVRSRVPDYADALGEIEPFSPSTALTGAAWSELLLRAVDRFHPITENDFAAATQVAEIAAMLRRADSWRRRFDAGTVIDAIEQVTLNVERPAEAGPTLVWVGDAMRFRGRTFDHVFVVRMEDDLFPQRRTDDPLLPDFDRDALELPAIGDGRDEERLMFQLLLDGASSSIHLSAGANDGAGKLIRPSRFMKQFAIEKEPDRRAEILRNFSVLAAVHGAPASAGPVPTRQLQLIAKSGSRSEFDGYLRVDAAIDARIRAALGSISPTGLEDFGECPQKFLLKHILGVRELDEPELELHVNAKDKGSLDHRILERFYRGLPEGAIDAAAASLPQLDPALRERLESIIEDEYDQLEARMPPFNPAMREIERRATKRHLRDFVAGDIADLVETGLRPDKYEYAFGPKFVTRGVVGARPDPFILQTRDIAISVEGSVDRIDVNDEMLRVVDYKSGKALRHRDLAGKIDRGVRMQLALYGMAVAEFFATDAVKIFGTIKPLRIPERPKFDFHLAQHAARLRETIDLFVGAMLRGEFPAFPLEKDTDFEACKYCPVNLACRTRHNDSDKYAVTRSGDPRTLLGGTE